MSVRDAVWREPGSSGISQRRYTTCTEDEGIDASDDDVSADMQEMTDIADLKLLSAWES